MKRLLKITGTILLVMVAGMTACDDNDDPQNTDDQSGVAYAQEPETSDDTVRSGNGDEDTPSYYPAERLTEADLEDRSLRELSLMRNTIFARAGQEFSTEWLREYFNDQPWYEGGGLDDDEFSERDRHNVRTIRAYETGLSELNLRNRRRDHWRSHGLPSDGQWSAPGPFEDHQDVVEAKLIDEALDALFEKTGAYRRPSDPGEHQFDDIGKLPDGFGELKLGQRLEASDQRDVEARVTTIEPLGIENRVVPVLDDDGRIQQLSAVIFTVDRDDLGEDVRRLTTMTLLATRLSEEFGEPEVVEPPRALEVRLVGTLKWEDDGRVVQLDNATEMGGGKPPRVVLHTGESDRVCGPADGFEHWYAGFEEAMASDDPEEVVDYLAFPFTDEGPAAGTAPPDYTSRRVEDRETFVQRGALGDLRPDAQSDPMCINTRAGYGVWTGGMLTGALRFYRIDGEWTAVGLTAAPF